MTGRYGPVPREDVDTVARILIAEWEEVEGPVTASYVANFADMAREVISHPEVLAACQRYAARELQDATQAAVEEDGSGTSRWEWHNLAHVACSRTTDHIWHVWYETGRGALYCEGVTVPASSAATIRDLIPWEDYLPHAHCPDGGIYAHEPHSWKVPRGGGFAGYRWCEGQGGDPALAEEEERPKWLCRCGHDWAVHAMGLSGCGECSCVLTGRGE